MAEVGAERLEGRGAHHRQQRAGSHVQPIRGELGPLPAGTGRNSPPLVCLPSTVYLPLVDLSADLDGRLQARARLLQLLRDQRPAGLVFLSGDVHHAEMAGFPKNVSASDSKVLAAPEDGGVVEKDGEEALAPPGPPWLLEVAGPAHIGKVPDSHRSDGARWLGAQVTSSGMTHTVTGSLYGRASQWIIRHYNEHRRRAESFFTELNWGAIELDWGGTAPISTSARISYPAYHMMALTKRAWLRTRGGRRTARIGGAAAVATGVNHHGGAGPGDRA